MNFGKKFLDEFWVLLSSLLGLLGFLNDTIQTDMLIRVFYILSIYLIILGIREMFEKREARRQPEKAKSKPIKEQGLPPKAVSTINLVVDTENQVESMVNNINIIKEVSKRMKEKLKNFFVWLWNNKLSLISILSSVIVTGMANYATLSGFLAEKLAFVADNPILYNVLVGIVSIALLAVNIFTTISKYGLESLEDIQARLKETAEAKVNALSSEDKKKIKNQISILNTGLKKAENTLADLTKQSTELSTYVDTGLATADQVSALSTVKKSMAETTALIEKFNTNIDELSSQLTE